MLKRVILIFMILLCVFAFADEEIEINDEELVQRIPGEYKSFKHIHPQGMILLDPEGVMEPERFKRRNDFALWLYETFLADIEIISGINMGWETAYLNANESYLRSVEGNEFYEYYKDTILKDLLGVTGSWFYDYRIGQNLWFQPEFKYHHYTSLLESGNFPLDNLTMAKKGNELEIEVDMHYVSLPMLLRYRISGDKYSSIYLLFGPGLNIFLSGDADWKYYYYLENGTQRNHYKGRLKLEDIQNATLSFNTSIGFSYHKLFIELRTETCMSSINNLAVWHHLEDSNSTVQRSSYSRSEQVQDFLLNAYDYQQFSISLNLGYRVGRSWYFRD